jgi:hypothetical protein
MTPPRKRPQLLITPQWVCVFGSERLLNWGIFERRSQAEARADAACRAGTGIARAQITIEHIWISKRSPR